MSHMADSGFVSSRRSRRALSRVLGVMLECGIQASIPEVARKTPPQPLPTRGRGLGGCRRRGVRISTLLLAVNLRSKEEGAADLPLPLVGRGWGGVFATLWSPNL